MRDDSQTACSRRELVKGVLYFTPRAELEPQENLETFVRLCKKSAVFRACDQFDKNFWEVGYRKGHNAVIRLFFSTVEAVNQKKYEPSMPAPFLDFAKAAIVYLQDKHPVVSPLSRLSALRYLEAALREWGKGSRPTAVNIEVLDTALEIAHKSVSTAVAYRVAGQLKLIADMMHSKGFIMLRTAWEHGLKKPRELGSRISKEAMQ